MTVGDESQALTGRLDSSEPADESPRPQGRDLSWIGMGESGIDDLAENHDSQLRETGFGQ